MSIKSVRLRIEGRVQGIWYRGWTVDQARALNIDGWVRNKADGSVVAVLSGAQDNVDAMTKVCHDGPPMARVDSIFVVDETNPVATGFKQV